MAAVTQYRARMRELAKRERAEKPRARRLATIAAWINENRPELKAVIRDGYASTDRPYGKGSRLSHHGKGRVGNRIIVTRKRGGGVLLDHNSAETYRCNDEVESWLAKYLAERKR